MCACYCVHVFVGACVHVYMCIQRMEGKVGSCSSGPFIFSNQDTVSNSLECAKWARMASEPRGSSPPTPPPALGLQACTIPGFLSGFWEPTQALRLMGQALH